MRRLTLLLAVVVAVSLLAAPTFGQTGGSGYSRAPRPPVFVQVIAADAPGYMQTGGPPDRYLCSATNAIAQIQAANDAVSAGGGGKVVLSPGIFDFASGVGTAYEGTCTTSTVGNNTKLTVSSWGTGSQSDVTVGDIVRVRHDGAGTDPATNNDDVPMTVTATTASPDTLTLDGLFDSNYDPDTLTVRRITPCVTISANVTLQGAGVLATRLRPMDGVDAAAIILDYAASGISLRDFHIKPQSDAASYDERECGIIVPNGCNEVDIRNVSAWYLAGDGFVFNNGHGVRIQGDSWTERNRGRGIIAAGLSELIIDGHMATVNYKDNILLKQCRDCSITNCYGTLDTAGMWWLRIQNSNATSITNNRVVLSSAADQGAFVVTTGYANTIANNTFRMESASTTAILLQAGTPQRLALIGNGFFLQAASTIGIDINGSYRNTIAGNVFYPSGSGSDAIDNTAPLSARNIVQNNGNVLWEDRASYCKAVDSGAGITQRYAVESVTGGGINEVQHATAAKSGRFLGVALSAIGADATGDIVTQGMVHNGPIDTTDAAGRTIAVGDELTISGTLAGGLVEAAGGEVVVAIAQEAQTAGPDGMYTDQKMYLLGLANHYLAQ